jgi:hypothetical protein
MPLPMETPTVEQKIQEDFDKPGIKASQSDPNYRYLQGARN